MPPDTVRALVVFNVSGWMSKSRPGVVLDCPGRGLRVVVGRWVRQRRISGPG